ncbi:MAG: hypothetical protein K9N62_02820 [Verrucomicrobia bacterium]|nr:hypothetical protein [Verrucomicrobiota bacterium]
MKNTTVPYEVIDDSDHPLAVCSGVRGAGRSGWLRAFSPRLCVVGRGCGGFGMPACWNKAFNLKGSPNCAA